jgi:hypothetical protein
MGGPMKNIVSRVLSGFAYAIYFFGFIGGIALANVTIPNIFGGLPTTAFVWQLAVAIWVSAAISGTLFLGLAEVVTLLQLLVDKQTQPE